ncbi:glycosyltransferase family 2 protein [Pedobacter helvus]|uniref:Glycosyltransferase family 2 protein n=1 Tax=Pedobacter helvus TaxID=2563444 RepID=A0ABW9JHC6_9SPHI|nr:glycosyltransferase family 2 protein [Pedobacter ureilyticus]
MPKISIITVNFNNLVGLKKTAESVLEQSYKDFEFIIIDGGSKDGSKEYIEEISTHLTLWVSEPDTGIYNAMNKGIKMAKGDYLCFLNSGDIFFDNSTLSSVANKINGEVGIYYGDVIFDQIRRKRIIPAPRELAYPFLIANSINHQSTFIKRTLFDEIFYYNEDLKIIADWEFIIYAVCKREIPTRHLDMVISIYDASGVSSIKENQKAIMADRQAVINKHFPLYSFNIDEIETLQSKRGKQFQHIKNHKVAYRVLKWLISLLLIFLPKENTKN